MQTTNEVISKAFHFHNQVLTIHKNITTFNETMHELDLVFTKSAKHDVVSELRLMNKTLTQHIAPL